VTPTHLLEVVGGMDQHDTDTDMSRQNPSPIRGGYISRPERRVIGNPPHLLNGRVSLAICTPSIFFRESPDTVSGDWRPVRLPLPPRGHDAPRLFDASLTLEVQ